MNQDDFNGFCSSLPATSHVVQWGGSDVWKVGDKVFAIGSWNSSKVSGITFKTSKSDYEMLREMPGFRPAPYLASRGMKWIQRYEDLGSNHDELRYYIAESHRLVVAGFSHKKRTELGL
jgi:predicted DNA-binding protein (MmcQ/YjbR family)